MPITAKKEYDSNTTAGISKENLEFLKQAVGLLKTENGTKKPTNQSLSVILDSTVEKLKGEEISKEHKKEIKNKFTAGKQLIKELENIKFE